MHLSKQFGTARDNIEALSGTEKKTGTRACGSAFAKRVEYKDIKCIISVGPRSNVYEKGVVIHGISLVQRV
jgi:hypothetical protein